MLTLETWIVGAFGLVIGSFLNVCIIRIPEGTFFSTARSHCIHCHKIIPIWHNVPVLSWLILRGRSACCDRPIPKMYPLVELLTSILFMLVYLKFPFVEIGGHGGQGILWKPFVFIRCMHMIMFTAVMIVVTVIDIRLLIIPDVISYPMILTSFLWIWLHPGLDWASSLLGIAVGGGTLYAVAWVYYAIRKDYGMGFGDVKLLAGIGGWLGVEAVMPTLFYGSVVGAIVGMIMILFSKNQSMKSKIPFGPFLALGAWTHMMMGRDILEWLML